MNTENTLFVLPLEDRFKCAYHGGLLCEPVRTTSGKNICQACATTSKLQVEGPNKDLQEDIDSLLCYCKHGVCRNSNGELIADPKGCDHIIKYGNRAKHEAECEFRGSESFVMVNPPDGTHSVAPSDNGALLPCLHKTDGCFYLAGNNEELRSHLATCSYERLRQLLRQSEARVSLLEQELQLRDIEVANLRSRLEGADKHPAAVLAKTIDSGKEVWEELIRIVGEQVPHGLSNAKEALISSSTGAFQSSTTSITQLKTKLVDNSIKVKKGIEDMHPLEKLNDLNEKLSEIHPLDRLINILSSLKSNLVTSMKDSYDGLAQHTTSNNNNDNNNNNTLAASLGSSVGVEEEEEMKKIMAESLSYFELEKRGREVRDATEAAAVAAAAAMSLSPATTTAATATATPEPPK